jgi:hypothetical protein
LRSGYLKLLLPGITGAPKLVLAIADKGNFGNICVGSFADEPLLANNSGNCSLLLKSIISSSPEFLVPEILSYPIAIAPDTSVSIPIRFQPSVLGPTPVGTHITVNSNDPSGPNSIGVSGNAPAGKIAVTGSTFFGEVKACCREARTIVICNVGDCKLHVLSVVLKRKNPYWKLINNPFPATLHAGSCLNLVIRYKATGEISLGLRAGDYQRRPKYAGQNSGAVGCYQLVRLRERKMRNLLQSLLR